MEVSGVDDLRDGLGPLPGGLVESADEAGAEPGDQHHGGTRQCHRGHECCRRGEPQSQ